jgi:cellobiose phosphorylase
LRAHDLRVRRTQDVRRTEDVHDGLQVAPVIPAEWTGFRATRVCRGATYEIEVQRAGPGGGVSLAVDGRPIDGEVVAPPPGRDRVRVVAALGRAE